MQICHAAGVRGPSEAWQCKGDSRYASKACVKVSPKTSRGTVYESCVFHQVNVKTYASVASIKDFYAP